jgi:hypothetical protein
MGLVLLGQAGLAELEADRHPAFALMEPEIPLAQGCVVASEGATSEAVPAATLRPT